jgi:hypothetical protein
LVCRSFFKSEQSCGQQAERQTGACATRSILRQPRGPSVHSCSSSNTSPQLARNGSARKIFALSCDITERVELGSLKSRAEHLLDLALRAAVNGRRRPAARYFHDADALRASALSAPRTQCGGAGPHRSGSAACSQCRAALPARRSCPVGQIVSRSGTNRPLSRSPPLSYSRP